VGIKVQEGVNVGTKVGVAVRVTVLVLDEVPVKEGGAVAVNVGVKETEWVGVKVGV
jgi:hypothetical protein